MSHPRKDIPADLWGRALQLAIGSFCESMPDPDMNRKGCSQCEDALLRLVDRWIDRGGGGDLDYRARNAILFGLSVEVGDRAIDVANEVWLLIRLHARLRSIN